jgi:hypothetical protein
MLTNFPENESFKWLREANDAAEIEAIGRTDPHSAVKVMFHSVKCFVLDSRDRALVTSAECFPSFGVEEASLC